MSIDVNIFKEIPEKYVTLFIDRLGRLSACNQPADELKTRGGLWWFDNIDGLSITVLEDGHDTNNWELSPIPRPCGVKGSNVRMKVKPIFIKKVPDCGLFL